MLSVIADLLLLLLLFMLQSNLCSETVCYKTEILIFNKNINAKFSYMRFYGLTVIHLFLK